MLKLEISVGGFYFKLSPIFLPLYALTAQGHDATSQIAGFINGVASLGSVLEGLLVGVIADAYGWHAVFYCITLMCFVSFAILFRAHRTFG